MRISRWPALAVSLTIGGLFAYLGMYGATAAAAPTASTIASQCESLPVAASVTPTASATDSSSASASASPTTAAPSQTPGDLCVSVQASQDTYQAGQAATWTVQTWAPNGSVYGVTVTLTSSLSGQLATFTGTCPGGNGSTSCNVGDLATAIAPESVQMQAQITVPSGTAAGTVITLDATANATPALPTVPAAATSVTVAAAPSPSPSSSASSSATAKPTTTATTASASATTTTPASTPASTLPLGIGTVPTLPGQVTPQTGVTAVANPGSITSLLPVVTPQASPTSPTAGLVTSPAADIPASPSPASASNFVLVIPTATAENLAIVALLVLVAVLLRLLAKDKLALRIGPGRAARGAHSWPWPTRGMSGKPSATVKPAPPAADSPGEDPAPRDQP